MVVVVVTEGANNLYPLLLSEEIYLSTVTSPLMYAPVLLPAAILAVLLALLLKCRNPPVVSTPAVGVNTFITIILFPILNVPLEFLLMVKLLMALVVPSVV